MNPDYATLEAGDSVHDAHTCYLTHHGERINPDELAVRNYLEQRIAMVLKAFAEVAPAIDPKFYLNTPRNASGYLGFSVMYCVDPRLKQLLCGSELVESDNPELLELTDQQQAILEEYESEYPILTAQAGDDYEEIDVCIEDYEFYQQDDPQGRALSHYTLRVTGMNANQLDQVQEAITPLFERFCRRGKLQTTVYRNGRPAILFEYSNQTLDAYAANQLMRYFAIMVAGQNFFLKTCHARRRSRAHSANHRGRA